MLCESRLWIMTFCGDLENGDGRCPPVRAPQDSVRTGSQRIAAAALLSSCAPGRLPSSTKHTDSGGFSILPPVTRNRRKLERIASAQPRALDPQRLCPDRLISPDMEIPGKISSGGDVPFLVPSSCQSICENYSDLHIGGDQVLPLSAHEGELLPCSETQVEGPFLQSCDVPPAAEDSLLDPTCQVRPKMRGGSSHWKQGSICDRSFLFQGREGPFSNSLLNRYLEHKLLDLYQQYMLESMAKHGAGSLQSDPSSPCLLLDSELVLTSLDQITQQLSREGNLESGLAKDMVISCLLRVAGSLQSTEISTPMLQISTEASGNQASEDCRGSPAPDQRDPSSADLSEKQ